ncbi:MAG: thiamine diphosphokinase [Treponema sp.]|nr:thiamine diphosphokinase [Treponema sp.]
MKKRMAERLGIVFTGGEGPRPELLRQIIGGNEALYAAADSGLMLAEAAGIKPDWIIGDMDSMGDQKRLDKYPAGTVLRFSHDKDFTDTELAIDLLRKKGCTEIWIAGGGGGRLDHILAVFYLFGREKFPARWVTAYDDIYCLDGAGKEINMEIPSGTQVSVLPLETGSQAESSGLKWQLDGIVWDRGSFGISNMTSENSFSIRVIRGRFLVMVPLPVSKAGFSQEE